MPWRADPKANSQVKAEPFVCLWFSSDLREYGEVCVGLSAKAITSRIVSRTNRTVSDSDGRQIEDQQRSAPAINKTRMTRI